MRLLLIRHGQTPSNVRGELDTGAPGPGLTSLGHAQAAGIPSALRDEKIDAVFVSSLVRTHQTAAPLATVRSLTPRELPGIHEIEAGDLEMATDHASYRGYLDTCVAWSAGDRDRVMAGASNGHDFFRRFDASIARLPEVSTAVVVSHGAAIRVWVAGTARNIEPHFTAHQELDNTGLVELEGSPSSGWELISWRGEPLGGAVLADEDAQDPTGEPVDEVLG